MTETDPLLKAGTKVCIVKPDIGLSTPSVFKALDYDELSELDGESTLLPAFLEADSIAAVKPEYFLNDLEPPAFRCVPELLELKTELQSIEGFTTVMMSGSGTSIFCIGEPADREQFLKQFDQREDVSVFFTEFTNRETGSWFQRS